MVDPGVPFSRAEALFDEFIRRRDSGAPVDFDRLCEDHPECRDELRACLRAHELLERLVPGPLQAEAPTVRDPRHEFWQRLKTVGPRSSRYESLGEIGRGGMGIVLRVRDEELRRTLAMKILRRKSLSGVADSDSRGLLRFLEEAQITSQLDHPSIVPVHEIGMNAEGDVYYTMRLVQGVTLSRIFEDLHADSRDWNQVRVLGVILKVCEAMGFAHTRGVLHRDLKPGNVMVGEFGEVYVMDWGLARVLGREDPHDLRLRPTRRGAQPSSPIDAGERGTGEGDSPLVTMDGDVLGTPAFMPPEQARGEVEALGPRSDVYAVGAMLYQLIGGRMPFVEPGEAASPQVVLGRLLRGPPRPLHEFAPAAPVELVSICEKAMARDPAERYPDMQALAGDLRAMVEGRVVSAYETGTLAETRKWIRRNGALAWSVAAGFAILIVGVTTSLFLLGRTRGVARDLQEQNEVFWAMARLDEFRHQSGDWSLVAGAREFAHGTTLEWWIQSARELVDGRAEAARASSQGLTAVRNLLLRLRQEALPATAGELKSWRTGFPGSEELSAKREKLLWYERMLGKEPWPAVETMEETLDPACADAGACNGMAWWMVDPRQPRYAEVARGLALARYAVGNCTDPARLPAFRDTLSWAQYHTGDFAAARAERAWVAATSPNAIWGLASDMPRLEDEITDWYDGTAERAAERLRTEVDCLEGEAAAWREWRFADPAATILHSTLVQLEDQLVELAKRLHLAEEASAPAAAARLWDESIAAIARSPRYGNFAITKQLDLLPLGPDPASGLWEFAHLPSGDPARRDEKGKLLLTRETGLVFVLLPGGRVPVRTGTAPHPINTVDLHPFFLSKYEMTRNQWQRLERRWPGRFSPEEHTLLPAVKVSWDDCSALLRETGGWLCLPSEAQWEYACRAGTTTRWSSGETPGSLEGMENVPPFHFLRRVGMFRGNPFGLHDMHANAREWCEDVALDEGRLRVGDGLREGFRPRFGLHRIVRGLTSDHPPVESSEATLESRDGGVPGYLDEQRGLRPAKQLTP